MQQPTQANDIQFQRAFDVARSLIGALESVIQGRPDTIRLVITALLSDGHALIEDYPGSGKTTLAKTLGRLISRGHKQESHIIPFRRVQFTPDMLPGDVLGVNVFEPKNGVFRFLHGPIFAHVVLADEINRTGPKVQAAFLECMAEKQVTIDNVTYPLDDLFFVLGTQNPLDVAGTYPLPQVQLDRFMFKLPMSYVSKEYELKILENPGDIQRKAHDMDPVCTREDILSARETRESIHLVPELREAIIDIVQATRGNQLVQFGASTRAAIMLQSACQGWALVHGRDFVTEDDLVAIAPYVLLHRLRFHAGAGNPEMVLRQIMAPFVERLIRQRR